MLEQHLSKYFENPKDPYSNLQLANEYYSIKQYASSFNLYMRAAELFDDNKNSYICLLKSSNCLYYQGNRIFAAKGCILHAISLCPDRPEGYYLYSRLLEINKEWQECYTMANIGLLFKDNSEIFMELDYPGEYALILEKAISAWWIGRLEESKSLISYLYHEVEMNQEFSKLVQGNMEFMKINPYLHTKYYQKYFFEFESRYHFPGLETIEENYSQCYQDMFVLSTLNGKRNGTYLEIGSGDPFYGNNTALLEEKFDWTGISIEIDENLANKFHEKRKNPVIIGDATDIDYNKLLNAFDSPKNIDYLQIDCDPAKTSYDILLKIPFNEFTFSVITFEHDLYVDPRNIEYQNLSREYLNSLGYILILGNISSDNKRPFEDWWIHKSIYNHNIHLFMSIYDYPAKKAEDIFLKKQ